MRAPACIFQLDRHTRFLQGQALPSTNLGADCPASDCADRPMSGRDFASPATSSINHSRDDLTARVSGTKLKRNGTAAFRNRSFEDYSGLSNIRILR